MMRTLLFYLFVSGLFVACNSNPYPEEEGGFFSDNRTIIRDIGPANGITNLKAEGYLFTEGEESIYTFDITVESGTPIVNVVGLPEGAIYDEENSSITWTPSYSQGDDPDNIEARRRVYDVSFLIGTLEDPVTNRTVPVKLIVQDRPRDFFITVHLEGVESADARNPIVFEESAKPREVKITVTDVDFPNYIHPMSVFYFDNDLKMKIPAIGARVSKDLDTPLDPTTHVLHYHFPFDFFKTGSDRSYDKAGRNDYDCRTKVGCDFSERLFIEAETPKKYTTSEDFFVAIKDVRKYAVGPSFNEPISFVEQSLFFIHLSDPNRERRPVLTVIKAPRFGRFEVKEIPPSEDQGPFNSVYSVSLSRVAEFVSEPLVAELGYCVNDYDDVDNIDHCRSEEVIFTNKAELYSAPSPVATFSSPEWGEDKMQYVKVGEKIETELLLAAASADDELVNVFVNPSAYVREVLWANNTLRIIGEEAGVKSANLVVQTREGGHRRVSIPYEVLPEDWPEFLIFNNTNKRSKTYQRFSNFLGENIEALDIEKAHHMQKRHLSYRETLVIADDFFNYDQLYSDGAYVGSFDENDIEHRTEGINSILENFSNIIMVSASSHEIRGKLKEELGQIGIENIFRTGEALDSFDYGNFSLELFTSQGNVLATFDVQETSRSEYYQSGGSMGPKGSRAYPYLGMSFVRMSQDSSCVPLATLKSKDGIHSFTAAVRCPRSNGGSFIIATFGFGNIQNTLTSFGDENVQGLVTWLGSLLE